jgi:thiol-disulfide isomerase/thioredoxin
MPQPNNEQQQQEELRVKNPGQAPDLGEIRTVEEALKLEHVMSKQKGEMYILMFADWCGHCQTYKPFWQRLRDMAGRMVKVAAVQDTQKENVPSLKDAPLNGYPTVIHVKEDGSMEPVDSTEMRDEEKMKSRVTKDNGHKGGQLFMGNDGGPIGKIIQAGAGLLSSVRKHLHSVRPLFPARKKTRGKKRASRRNGRSRKVKRAGRKL